MHAKMSRRFALIACLLSLWFPSMVHGAAALSPSRIAPPAGIAIATRQPMNDALGRWTHLEFSRFTNKWRAQFRGDARVKNDLAVTDEDIAAHNLILFGDPRSNRLLARIARQLPLRWHEKRVQLGKVAFSSAQCVPAFIHPNPLDPTRYIVVNSGFTFWREGSASNAQQTPKLPDFALMDMTAEATGRTEERIRSPASSESVGRC